MKRTTGQSISEYMLAGSLIAVVAIGALTFLANDIAAALPGILDSIFGGGGNGNSVAVGGGPSGGTGANGGAPAQGSGPAINTMSFVPTQSACFNSGLCVDVPVVAADVKLTETAGGMGSDLTHQMATVLQQIAQQLENADPPIDPAFISLITDLANRGHDLADAEGLLPDYFNEMNGTCNGTFCTAEEVDTHLQTIQGAGGLTDEFKSDLALVNDFLNNNPGVLSDFPEAEYIINFEAGEIIHIAEGLQGGFDVNAEEDMQYCADCNELSFSITNHATLTEQSADVICHNGGDTSSCSARARNQH